VTDTSRNFSQLGILLPSQHFQARRQPMPERRLMAAVLDEALDCLDKYRAATDPSGRRVFAEARQWLLADEPEWPFSFASICAVLDLDATAVLDRLLADGSEAGPSQRGRRSATFDGSSWPRSAAGPRR
jgi:hypothetical protein